jgi:D-xylose transport system substrate-binding protein
MYLLRSKAACAALAVTAGVTLSACGSSSSSSSSSTASSASAPPSTPLKPATVSVAANAFANDFSSMSALKSVAASGKGKVAAILPDTVSSTRYVEFDQPDIKSALSAAGVPSSDVIVQNAGGSDSTMLTDAQSDITNGATVLLIDPLDSGVGTSIENYAKSHGVKVIDYDRLTLGGSRSYYVSFDNVKVGKVMGQGLVSCVAAEHVANPNVIVMHGDPTDNNATLFYTGYYNQVLQPLFAAGKWKDVANPPGTWLPPTALTSFQQAFTAHPNINAALIPNDENGAPIITYLKTRGVKANTFPTSGQDATLTGLQNVLSGYQCGTVYKAVYKEAQAAVALAIYLRAGQAPPPSLANGSTTDTKSNTSVPSVLLTPVWVTPKNMNATIIADKFVPSAQLCAGAYASACKKAGIS